MKSYQTNHHHIIHMYAMLDELDVVQAHLPAACVALARTQQAKVIHP
jgi:hypothetical protein